MHYEALCVHERMERGGVRPDIVTFKSLINGYCKKGRMREALRFFKEIKGAIPNHVTFTILIDGYCRVNELDEPLQLREEMERKGLFPGVVTYNSILRKFCEEGRLKDANKLLNEMGEKKIDPDNITSNTLINAYCKLGDMRSGLKVRSKMLDAGLKPDQFTYKALIHGFCKAKEMESAKELLFDMLDAGCCPSYCTYSWIMDGYCGQGNEEAVVKLQDEFVQRVLALGKPHFSIFVLPCFLHKYTRSYTFEQQRGLCVNISVYRALIRRFFRREKVDYAQRIFSTMQGRGISRDCVVYTSLAYAYLKAGKEAAASDLLDEMYHRRLMIIIKIYRSFNASYAGDNNIFGYFLGSCLGERPIFKNYVQAYSAIESKCLKESC
ncbi:hypothetical protein RJ639_038778 [Escallonia herrerae]|uniref:Pentatricopeptide repeat-containing protein n=1 Tax=Escallonia herrerae TaxID=1293975 RepID=A0AA88WMD3_9ASTE|nr:hypothetical protein RJ639_038778 [Escallonia herrerae]